MRLGVRAGFVDSRVFPDQSMKTGLLDYLALACLSEPGVLHDSAMRWARRTGAWHRRNGVAWKASCRTEAIRKPWTPARVYRCITLQSDYGRALHW